MSDRNDDAARAFQQKEAEWKNQLSALRAKLTQAGSHLKTLTQENAKLSKQISQHATLEATWKKEREESSRATTELVTALQTVLGHQTVPDVSSPAALEKYASTAETRFAEKLKQTKSEAEVQAKEANEALQKLKAENEKLSEQLKAAASSQKGSPTPDSSSSVIEPVRQSLRNITEDIEDGAIDSSLPPELIQSFENFRSSCVKQLDTLQREKRLAENAQNDLKRQTTLLQLSVNNVTEEKEKIQTENEGLKKDLDESKDLKARLETAEKQKEESESRVKSLQEEHQNLISKLSHLKETLAPRLEADKMLRQRVSELTTKLESTERDLSQARADMLKRDNETSNQLGQQEREINQLQSQILHVRHEKEEWQESATEFEAQRNQLEADYQRVKSEFDNLIRQREGELKEHEFERTSLANLQTVLEEFQASKDSEVRAAVEHIQRQLDTAKKSSAEYQERAHVAESSLAQYQQDVAKTQRYEQEIKEKNLLIGKLRHEAIILNEHLIEAMRRLKEESNDSNVDRQLIANLISGFFLAPRGDQKRFEILSIIASVLQMSDEQKEHIGLIRPNKNSQASFSPNSSPPGSLSARQHQQNNNTQQSFTDAWISFLLKESSAYHPSKDSKDTPVSAPDSPAPDNTADI